MKEKKLNLFLLVTLIVGTIIGGGIYNSPTDLILKANPQAALIAWFAGGVGMLMLVLVFYKLSIYEPNLDGGIYSYAKEGFGNYVGFNSFWGYWTGAIFGNIAFITLFFKTLNSILPHPLPPLGSFIGGSIIVWLYTLIAWRGVHEASVVNSVITLVKVLPLILLIIVGLTLFKPGLFNVSHWTTVLASTGHQVSTFKQVGQAMSTIVWCFVGIEAAVSMSRQAKTPQTVGVATLISFAIVWILYIFISLLPMGIIPSSELKDASVPLAWVLEKSFVGNLGALLIKLGLLVSTAGALFSWFIIGPEITYITAKDHSMPKMFSHLNRHGIPGKALLVYALVMQVLLLIMLLPELQTAYTITYTLAATTTLIAYLLSALYGVKLSLKIKKDRGFLITSILASLYLLYSLYVTGVIYAFGSLIIFAIGIPLYLHAAPRLSYREKVLAVIIGALGIIAFGLIITGTIKV